MRPDSSHFSFPCLFQKSAGRKLDFRAPPVLMGGIAGRSTQLANHVFPPACKCKPRGTEVMWRRGRIGATHSAGTPLTAQESTPVESPWVSCRRLQRRRGDVACALDIAPTEHNGAAVTSTTDVRAQESKRKKARGRPWVYLPKRAASLSISARCAARLVFARRVPRVAGICTYR